MKKASLSFLATIALGFVALFTACSSDSKEEPVTDYNAGEFKIINTTRGNKELVDGSVEVYKGDVLKIQFSSKYKKNFNKEYSVYVGKNKVNIENEQFKVSTGDTDYAFTLKATYDEGETHLSASQNITIKQKYKVTVPYVLYITEDLKDLVKVNVDYSNEEGKTYPMEELPGYIFETHEDVYTYEDEGFTFYTFNKQQAIAYAVHKGPMTAQTTPMLVLEIPYYRFNIDTEIILTYQQKADVEEREYNIGREFQRKKASIVSPTEGANDKDWKYSLPLFTGEKKTASQTRDYIGKIVKEKDVIKLHIDNDGNVTERK